MDHERLLSACFPAIEIRLSARDAAIYALSIGLGADPLDRRDLDYTLDPAMLVYPTMASVIADGSARLFDGDYGLDLTKVLHAGERVTIARPIPLDRPIVSRFSIAAIYDKGPGRAAILHGVTRLSDGETGALLARVDRHIFLIGAGGFGGPAIGPAEPWSLPSRDPDFRRASATLPQQAQLFRLNGDHNRVHVDPALSERAGWPRPILHGLCSFGIVCDGMLRAIDADPGRLHMIDARFTAPVFPGETLVTDIWREDGAYRFRTSSAARGVVLLDRGAMTLVD